MTVPGPLMASQRMTSSRRVFAAPRGAADKHVADELAPRKYQRAFVPVAYGVQGRVAAAPVGAGGQGRSVVLQEGLQFLGVLRRPLEGAAQ